VSLARRAVLGGLRLYKRFVSPMLPVACRFEPTCSEYAMAAVSRHGIARGLWLAAKRIVRCRPGGGGGADPVPP
jgi:putative membrane protein insertion efficiency factor